jgi:transcriptional regulator with XRE-family HTH domain
MDDLDIFARNLERIRIAKGYTHENLAHDAGVARSYLSNLKNKANAATIPMLARLAETLGVRSHHLLNPELEVVEVTTEDAAKGVPMSTATIVYVVHDQTSKRQLRT